VTADRPAARREGPGRPRDPHADDAIMRAALDLLVERGVERTSIEQVAKRAGVAKVTVYRRWRTKEDLLAQAVEGLREDLPTVTAHREPDEALPDVIARLLPRWGELLSAPRFRALSARVLAAGADHPRLLEVYRTHYVLPRRERARAIMVRAQAEGHLAADADVDVLIDMMEGAVIQRLLLTPGPLDPAETARYLRAVLVQAGFALPPPGAGGG
jgi:AcrR family transcriptional regulator